ncbi:MAG: type II toxin-antitoxin system HicB family antitoxin [Myxococcales bacterium]|nr:MAG: type II toxin-antitoxin system HicB family antitoxin [Myxococcales bacterium]
MHRYLIVIEKAGRNYSAFAPDLPGCAATGRTRSEAEKRMLAAIRWHLEGLREDGLPIPKSSATAEVLEVELS